MKNSSLGVLIELPTGSSGVVLRSAANCGNIIVLVSMVSFRIFLPAVTELRSYAGSHSLEVDFFTWGSNGPGEAT